MIRVVVCGSGNMGSLVLATIEAQDDMEPVGIIEPLAEGTVAGDSQTVYAMHADPATLFATAQPDVVVDFTNSEFTSQLVDAALEHGVRPVIGTSGVPADVVDRLRSAPRRAGYRRSARAQLRARCRRADAPREGWRPPTSTPPR